MSPTQWPVGWPRTWPMRILAGLWSLPGGLLSMLVALVIVVVEQPRYMGGLEFECHGPIGRHMESRGWAAWTCVWCRFYWVSPDLVLRRHEGRHVAQALAMSVFMAPVYLLSLLCFGYDQNPFECDARAHEIVDRW